MIIIPKSVQLVMGGIGMLLLLPDTISISTIMMHSMNITRFLFLMFTMTTTPTSTSHPRSLSLDHHQ
jgi:hypothetical protein